MYHVLRVCTWKLRSLNWESVAVQLVDVLTNLWADMTDIQEVRRTRQGRNNHWNSLITYRHIVGLCLRIDRREGLGDEGCFNEHMKRTYEDWRSYDAEIVLGYFNAMVKKEDIFGATVGRFSFYDRGRGSSLVSTTYCHSEGQGSIITN